MNVSWTDNADNETHFLLERSTDGVHFRRIASLGANTTEFIDSNLTGGMQYQYRLRSVNGIGGSKWVRGSGTTVTEVPPAAPSGFTATGVSTSSIQLGWTDNATNELNFLIDRSSDGVTFSRIASLSTDATSFTDTGLSAGQTYYYNIKAVNLTTGSKWVRASAATENPPSPPPPPPPPPTQDLLISEDFSNDAGSFTAVDGTWSAASGTYSVTSANTSGTTHLNNRAVHATDVLGDFTLTVDASVADGGTSWNDLGVIFDYQDPNNYYFFSSNQSNDDATSGIFKVVDGVSTELADISGGITPGTTYHLSVVRSGDRIDAYRDGTLVASATDSTFTSGQVGLGTKNDRATFDNFVVTGTAAETPEPPSTPPVDPSDLVATTVSSSKINLTWTDNSDDEASFRVERSTAGGSWDVIATLVPNTTSYSAIGLDASTTYNFRVRAYNTVGYSGYTATATATTQEAAQAGAQPGESNTGVSAPELLHASGSINVTTDGAVIENLDITGTLTINADNVTVRNCRITAPNTAYAVKMNSGVNLLIEDCEITGPQADTGLVGANFTARRLNIHHLGGDGIKPRGDNLIEACWVHNLGMEEGSHADGVQIRTSDGSPQYNIVLRGNYFDMPHSKSQGQTTRPEYDAYGSNACVFVECPTPGFIAEGNWFNGGNYCVGLGSGGAVYRNNYFGRDFNWGIWWSSSSDKWNADSWINNRWMDTNAVINLPA
jgi:hypothetical protein